MASLPNPRTVTYEEWLRMPEVTDFIEEVVDGEIPIMPPNKWGNGFLRSTQVLTQGVLEPKQFPGVQIQIAEIWPD
jgi:Uma2 family endonuclease